MHVRRSRGPEKVVGLEIIRWPYLHLFHSQSCRPAAVRCGRRDPTYRNATSGTLTSESNFPCEIVPCWYQRMAVASRIASASSFRSASQRCHLVGNFDRDRFHQKQLPNLDYSPILFQRASVSHKAVSAVIAHILRTISFINPTRGGARLLGQARLETDCGATYSLLVSPNLNVAGCRPRPPSEGPR